MSTYSGQSLNAEDQTLAGQAIVDGEGSRFDVENLAHHPSHQSVQSTFEAYARHIPDAIALQYGAIQLTYAELNGRANQFAHYLRSMGVTSEVCIALCMERSLEMIIAIIGILKAGGVYVPLEVAHPQERLAFIIKDVQTPIIITQQALQASVPVTHAHVVCIDTAWGDIAQFPSSNPGTGVTAANLVYIMYTSGSTGQPKGVGILHSCIINLVKSSDYVDFSAREIFLFIGTLAFDASTFEIWGALLNGARLVIFPPQLPSFSELGALVEQLSITTTVLSTGFFHSLVQSQPEALRTVRQILTGGDVLSVDAARRLLQVQQEGYLINVYGPTESTTLVCCYRLTHGEQLEQAVPIGTPVARTHVYVLDESFQQVPIGSTGELFIGGERLARGYFQRPDLTAERFLPDPFSTLPGRRLYRSGDRVRIRHDGVIEFLGRADRQIKLRGFRIELGEIETTLTGHTAVQQACVLLYKDEVDEKRIVAYVVFHPGQQVSMMELRNFMQTKLPEYMLPATLIPLESFPLNANGKLDQQALPKPSLVPDLPLTHFVAPHTQLEQQVAMLWCEILGVPQVGLHDDFFTLGGHSLLAMRIVARLSNMLQKNVPLRLLFEASTVQAFAQQLSLLSSSQRLPPIQGRTQAYFTTAPLSPAQERLWLFDQLIPLNFCYNVPIIYQLTGSLQVNALEQAIQMIIQRHEILRTTYARTEQQPVQVIHPHMPVSLRVVDISALPSEQKEMTLRQLADAEALLPFDLQRGPLLRTTLVQLAPATYTLFYTLHHITIDDWSLQILSRELAVFYEAILCKHSPSLPSLPIHYADFALWQRQQLQGEVLLDLLAYWKQQLAGVPPVLELPTDYPRPAIQSFAGRVYKQPISMKLSDDLRFISRQEDVTLFMTLFTAFSLLLARYSKQEDFLVGTFAAERTNIETELLIGLFMNVLLIRCNLTGDPTVQQLIKRMQQATINAYAHQALPFEKIVGELQPERDLSRQPLFQVLFALQTDQKVSFVSADIEGKIQEIHTPFAKVDFSLYVIDDEQGLILQWEYCTALFKEKTVQRMAQNLVLLLQSMVHDIHQSVSSLSMLPSEEARLLELWSNGEQSLPLYESITDAFEAQVRLTSDAVAIHTDHEQVTYFALEQQVNHLAHWLRAQNVPLEGRVGVCLPAGTSLIVALLAILKAGAAYVPLDANAPHDRLAYLVGDAQLCMLLTLSSMQTSVNKLGIPLTCLDQLAEQLRAMPSSPPEVLRHPDLLAYSIYTSGSTGLPKGVLVPHGGVCNLVPAQQKSFQIQANSRILQYAALSFDISISEMLVTLLCGATLCLVEQRQRLLPGRELGTILQEQGISIISLLPSVLAALPETTLQGIQTIGSVGEACSSDLVRRWGREHWFCDAYGPTETTIYATFAAGEQDVARIGIPLANMQAYVLDTYMHPTPIGVAGELYIGGVGVTRGYQKKPELTAERFVPHPWGKTGGERLYRTGDRVRWGDDGQLEYLGRWDQQIKLRGYRIELGEIEMTLKDHPLVQDAAVVLRKDTPTDPQIAAYVVAKQQQALDTADLYRYLRTCLPEYMLPSAIMLLAELPSTANGKIDRKRLPDIAISRKGSGKEYVPPGNQLEHDLMVLWQEVLHVEQVGIHDNFFDLGGHSLLVTQFQTQAQKQYGLQIAIIEIFQYPTIHTLANYWQQKDAEFIQHGAVQQGNTLGEKLKTGKDRLTKRRTMGKKDE